MAGVTHARHGRFAQQSRHAPATCTTLPYGHASYLQLLGHHAPHDVANEADVEQHLDTGAGRAGAAGFRYISGQGAFLPGAQEGGGGLRTGLACCPDLPRQLPAAAPSARPVLHFKQRTYAAQQLDSYTLYLFQLALNITFTTLTGSVPVPASPSPVPQHCAAAPPPPAPAAGARP